MTRKQLNVRISDETRKQLKWLHEDYGESEGELVSRAIALMYNLALHRYLKPDPVTHRLIEQAYIDEAETEDAQRVYIDYRYPIGEVKVAIKNTLDAFYAHTTAIYGRAVFERARLSDLYESALATDKS